MYILCEILCLALPSSQNILNPNKETYPTFFVLATRDGLPHHSTDAAVSPKSGFVTDKVLLFRFLKMKMKTLDKYKLSNWEM
jgi:hypothetical protein